MNKHVIDSIRHDNLVVLKQLITEDEALLHINHDNFSILEWAVHSNALNCTRWLVEEKHVAIGKALIIAIRYDRNQCALYLITQCNIHEINFIYNGYTALSLVSDKGSDYQIAKRLIKKGSLIQENNRMLLGMHRSYERKIKRRKLAASKTSCALYHVFLKKNVPKDLTRFVLRRFIEDHGTSKKWQRCF
jgi:hypothetical protein